MVNAQTIHRKILKGQWSKNIPKMVPNGRKKGKAKRDEEKQITIGSLTAELIDAIVARTHLSRSDIKNLDIEQIGKKLGIKAKTAQKYFAWEEGEKMGVQLAPYKFVPKEVLDKREQRMDVILRKL